MRSSRIGYVSRPAAAVAAAVVLVAISPTLLAGGPGCGAFAEPFGDYYIDGYWFPSKEVGVEVNAVECAHVDAEQTLTLTVERSWAGTVELAPEDLLYYYHDEYWGQFEALAVLDVPEGFHEIWVSVNWYDVSTGALIDSVYAGSFPFGVDSTPPDVEVRPGGLGFEEDGVLFVAPHTPIELVATDAGIGVYATYWAFDGGELSEGGFANASGLADGEHILRVEAVDRLAHRAAREFAVVVDGTAPQIALDGPRGVHVSAPPLRAGPCDDPAYVGWADVIVLPPFSWPDGAPHPCADAPPALAPGVAAPPTIVFVGSAESWGSVSDVGLGTAWIEHDVDGVLLARHAQSDGDWRTAYDLSEVTPGVHEFTVRGVDRVGNVAEVAFRVLVASDAGLLGGLPTEPLR